MLSMPKVSWFFIFEKYNEVSSIKTQRTNSESQCGKVIHKKSVGRAGNSNFLNFPPSPLIFNVYFLARSYGVRPRPIFPYTPISLSFLVTWAWILNVLEFYCLIFFRVRNDKPALTLQCFIFPTNVFKLFVSLFCLKKSFKNYR